VIRGVGLDLYAHIPPDPVTKPRPDGAPLTYATVVREPDGRALPLHPVEYAIYVGPWLPDAVAAYLRADEYRTGRAAWIEGWGNVTLTREASP
jgi:hypothetical protein